MPPYPLISFEIQKYYQTDSKFNSVCSTIFFIRVWDFLMFTKFPFTTSETMYDYYLWTWYIQVASPVPEPLKT